MPLGKTARYYHSHPESRKKKLDYDLKYESTPERKKYRSLLAIARHKRHLTGDARDLSHTRSGKLVLENRKANRSRNGHGDNGRLKP